MNTNHFKEHLFVFMLNVPVSVLLLYFVVRQSICSSV